MEMRERERHWKNKNRLCLEQEAACLAWKELGESFLHHATEPAITIPSPSLSFLEAVGGGGRFQDGRMGAKAEGMGTRKESLRCAHGKSPT